MHEHPAPKKVKSLGRHEALHIPLVNVLLVTVSSFFHSRRRAAIEAWFCQQKEYNHIIIRCVHLSALSWHFYTGFTEKTPPSSKNVFIKVPRLRGHTVCVWRGAALLKQLLYQCVCVCVYPLEKVLRWINKQAHTTAINNYWAAPQRCTLWRRLKIKCFLLIVRLCLILLWPVN